MASLHLFLLSVTFQGSTEESEEFFFPVLDGNSEFAANENPESRANILVCSFGVIHILLRLWFGNDCSSMQSNACNMAYIEAIKV